MKNIRFINFICTLIFLSTFLFTDAKANGFSIVIDDDSATVGLFLILGLVLLLLCVLVLLIRNRKILWSVAYIDPRTGMGNLNKFKLDAEKIIRNNPDKRFQVLMLDINKFNLINEMYSYEEGNIVIKAFCDTLVEQNSSSNTYCVARVRADNFILISEVMDEDEAKSFLIKTVASVKEKTGHFLQLCTGRYIIDEGFTNIDLIYERVNYAHNISKQNPLQGTIYDYDDDIKKQAIRHKEIEAIMEQALEDNEFVVYLQPKYRLLDESLAGAESLVRWQKKDGGVVFPSEFIPLFEANGFIQKLDMYMFTQTCKILNAWREEGKNLITISNNFSRLHLNNPTFVDEIISISDEYGVPRSYLEIELTESTIFDNEEVLEDILYRLHNAGFTLSMDDFGSGYSSLGLLKNLPVDVIKFDRAFFSNNRYKSRARTVIESVVQMAKELGIQTVAEGVELPEHVELLKELGCEIVQGYYYAKPMPFEQLSTFDVDRKPYEFYEPEYNLKLEDLGDIEVGRSKLGSDMPVLVYRLFEFSVREALTTLYGAGEMENALRYAGKISGRIMINTLLDKKLSFDEFIPHFIERMDELGIGVVNLEKFEKDSGFIVFTVQDDLDCSGTSDIGRTVCNYDEGIFAGVLYEYTNKAYSVVEVDCWSTGAEICRFECRPK